VVFSIIVVFPFSALIILMYLFFFNSFKEMVSYLLMFFLGSLAILIMTTHSCMMFFVVSYGIHMMEFPMLHSIYFTGSLSATMVKLRPYSTTFWVLESSCRLDILTILVSFVTSVSLFMYYCITICSYFNSCLIVDSRNTSSNQDAIVEYMLSQISE
jgi:hypothetical protein